MTVTREIYRYLYYRHSCIGQQGQGLQALQTLCTPQSVQQLNYHLHYQPQLSLSQNISPPLSVFCKITSRTNEIELFKQFKTICLTVSGERGQWTVVYQSCIAVVAVQREHYHFLFTHTPSLNLLNTAEN